LGIQIKKKEIGLGMWHEWGERKGTYKSFVGETLEKENTWKTYA
jgi:hypothetical protein